jgi:hypothetical protein
MPAAPGPMGRCVAIAPVVTLLIVAAASASTSEIVVITSPSRSNLPLAVL